MVTRLGLVGILVVGLYIGGCGGDGGGGNGEDDGPIIESCSLNGGADYTLSRTVTVMVDATDDHGIDHLDLRISCSSSFSGATWVPYQSSSQFELPAGDGTKTVYMQVKDGSDQLSNVPSEVITLAENSTVVHFDPTPLDLASGETGAVDLEILNAQAMVSGRFDFSFDPSLIEITGLVVDVGTSHILRLTGATIVVSDNDIDNTAGSLVIGALALKDGFEGVTGDGPFAEVTVRAKTTLTSSTQITFDEYQVYNYVSGNPPELATNVFVFEGEIE